MFSASLLLAFSWASTGAPDVTLTAAFRETKPEALSSQHATLARDCESSKLAATCYHAALGSYLLALTNLQADEDAAANQLAQCGRFSALAGTQDTQKAEADALLSACYGLSIALNASKGMALGPASTTLLADAERLAPTSPRVHYFAAMRLFRTPKIWGGDPVKALAHAERALKLFEDSEANASGLAWGKPEVAHLIEQIKAEK